MITLLFLYPETFRYCPLLPAIIVDVDFTFAFPSPERARQLARPLFMFLIDARGRAAFSGRLQYTHMYSVNLLLYCMMCSAPRALLPAACFMCSALRAAGSLAVSFTVPGMYMHCPNFAVSSLVVLSAPPRPADDDASPVCQPINKAAREESSARS